MILNVNGYKWNVINVSDSHDERLQLDDGSECFGITNYLDLAIYILNSVSKEIYRSTVLHELCHVYAFSYGHDFTHMTEETLCYFVQSHFDAIGRDAEKIISKMGVK